MERNTEKQKELTQREFHRKTNIITLLLLVYIVILLITTSKVMDRLGQMEIEQSYITGEATGNISLTILQNNVSTAQATTTQTEAAAVLFQPLTSSKTLVKFKPLKFAIDLYLDEEKDEILELTNILKIPLDLDFTSNLEDFINFEPNKIHLDPGETKNIKVRFSGKEPGVSSGYIVANGKTIKSFMLVILNVNSVGMPGQIEINLPEQFKQVNPGDNIFVSIYLSGFDNEIVEINYIIKNLENDDVFKVSQNMNIKDSLRFDKNIELPKNIAEGLYILAVELNRGGKTIVDSEAFAIGLAKEPEIESPGILEKKYVITEKQFKMILVSVIALIILAAVLYVHEVKTIKHFYGRKR